jgi:hypothetical protein
MLENSDLLLRQDEHVDRRLILAAETETVVGFARWRRTERVGWLRVLSPRVLEVREQEDEPLLCTLRRCWTLLPWFAVRDADDQPVGRFLGPVIQDRDHCRCAVYTEDGDGKQIFHSPSGVCLARLNPKGRDLHLVFDPVIDKEPFVKMLLLAFVIRNS